MSKELERAILAPAPSWQAGAPPKPYSKEWFIAETTYGDRVVLVALPEDYTYDFKTADETHIKADKIKRWMQFPDSQFLFPNEQPAPKQKILATEPTDEMVIAAMRAMEKCQPERLRYTERQKWHVNDMQGMRAALKAAFALMQPVPERLMPTPFTVEKVARLLCYERVAPACDCKQQGIPCKAPIENLLHESNPIRYQAEAVAKFIRPVPEQSIPASTATP